MKFKSHHTRRNKTIGRIRIIELLSSLLFCVLTVCRLCLLFVYCVQIAPSCLSQAWWQISWSRLVSLRNSDMEGFGVRWRGWGWGLGWIPVPYHSAQSAVLSSSKKIETNKICCSNKPFTVRWEPGAWTSLEDYTLCPLPRAKRILMCFTGPPPPPPPERSH